MEGIRERERGKKKRKGFVKKKNNKSKKHIEEIG